MSETILILRRIRQEIIINKSTFWNEQSSKGEEGIEEERRSEGTDDNEDMITIEELNEVLKHAKKQEKLWIR